MFEPHVGQRPDGFRHPSGAERGLAAEIDPIAVALAQHEGPPLVHSSGQYLADPDPGSGAADDMHAPRYYRAFLDNDVSRYRLISFGSPTGQYGSEADSLSPRSEPCYELFSRSLHGF